MKYDEAIEKMIKAFSDRSEYVGYELVNEEDCLRAAAEAIGLREMMEALEQSHNALRFCRMRLKNDAYRERLDKMVSIPPATDSDEPKVIQSDALSPAP